MEFTIVETAGWARAEHFHHYLHDVRCTYSLTVPIDITRLRQEARLRGLKEYPIQIHLLAQAVNRFPEFRMALDAEGRLGCWDAVSPLYTAMGPGTETFSCIWTEFSDSFRTFYSACIQDIAQYATGAFAPKQPEPPNLFNVSSVPWLDFTAFNLNIYGEGAYLPPIFTIGKYIITNDRTVMPLAIQVHHAVCDGVHVGRFVDAVRQLAEDCPQWLDR